MRNEPLVSIITPTFNRAYILPETINTVLAQTYTNWEMIIVDDGSTDNTKEVVAAFNDSRIKYHYQSNQRQAVARNNAFGYAKGDWIAYLDSDNELFPEYLEVMLYELQKHPNALYAFPTGYRFLELYQNNELVKKIDDTKDFPEIITVKDIFHRKLHTDLNGFMHSRKIIDSGTRFDKMLKSLEDWDFILTICEKYPENFLYIPKILYTYHQRFGGDGAVSNTNYRQWADYFRYIYHKHANDKLMEGQTWYPDRVIKWNKIADDYDKGLVPPYHLYYFQDK